MALSRTRLILLALLTAPLALSAQNQPQDQPQRLRVAIVGLEHGHVEGFLKALPPHHDVELVGLDDDATIVLQYPHAQAVIQASWNWPFSRKDMEVYGSTGYALTVGPDQVRLRYQHDYDEKLITAPKLETSESNSLDYLAAVLSGKIKNQGDLSALDTNLIVMQILDAARTSAREGRTVRLTTIGE